MFYKNKENIYENKEHIFVLHMVHRRNMFDKKNV